jgi:hypothetical protein
MCEMMMGAGMWAGILGGLLFLVLVVLAIAALVKYVFYRSWRDMIGRRPAMMGANLRHHYGAVE